MWSHVRGSSHSGSFIGVMHELGAVWGFLLVGDLGICLLLENAVLWGGGGSGQNQRGTGEGLVTALLVQLSCPFWMASNSSGGPEPVVA